MSMTDPIADFLTRVRNAIHAAHETVDIPASTLKSELAQADAADPELAINRARAPTAIAASIGARFVFGWARLLDAQRDLGHLVGVLCVGGVVSVGGVVRVGGGILVRVGGGIHIRGRVRVRG